MAREILTRRQPLLFQPVETVAPFSFSELVEETRAVWFPELEDLVEVRFLSYGPLASAWNHRMGYGSHIIAFHPLLNRPDIPIEVVRFIAKHELTHLVIKQGGHPPEFWEHEYRVAPERFAAWAWIRDNLGSPIRENRSGVHVLRTWRSRAPEAFAPYTPHLPFDDLPWKVLCPEGGAQLRFLPEWSAAPAPLAG